MRKTSLQEAGMVCIIVWRKLWNFSREGAYPTISVLVA